MAGAVPNRASAYSFVFSEFSVPICELANESSLLPKSRGELSREVLRARADQHTQSALRRTCVGDEWCCSARPRKSFYLGR